MKMSKDTIIKLSFVGLIVIGLGGFIAYKVHKFKKAQAENISVVNDPNIKRKTEYDQMSGTERNNLTSQIDEKDKKKDSTVVEKKVEKKTEAKRTVQVKQEEKKPESVQDKLAEKVDKIEEKRKPVKREEPVKEEKREENVKFNFVIVKDDEILSEKIEVKESGKTGVKDDVKLYKGKIYGQQRIKTNEPVIVRNTEEFVITKPKRVTIPASSVLYGTCRLAGNRMFINLTSATTMYGDYPIDIEVYDSDYIKGIFVKEGIETGVDQSSDAVINDATSNFPNQLAGTVVRTTTRQIQKSLARQERVTVTLEDGYSIMLGVPEVAKK